MTKALLSLLLVALFASPALFAADTATASKPRFVLVILHAEKNRLGAANKLGDIRIINTIKNDAEQVRTRTIMDFSENFHSYPVYYCMDSNMEKVLSKQFGDLLMNADGTLASNVSIDTASPNYVIVQYTWGDYQGPFETVITDKDRYLDEAGRSQGRGLVVYNSKMQQLSHYYKFPISNPRTIPLEEAKKLPVGNLKRYFYKSKKYDIEYYPMATELNDALAPGHKKKSNSPF